MRPMSSLDGTADLDRLRSFLRRQPVLNSVPLGIVSRALEAEAHRAGLFVATVERDGELIAAGLRSDFPKLSLAAAGSDEDIAEVARLVFARMPDLPCVLGPVAQATAFATEWQKLSGVLPRAGMPQRIHVLSTLHMPEVAGGMREAIAADTELVVEWVMAFEAEAAPDQGRSRKVVREAVDRNIASRSTFLWVDKAPVSMASAREFGEGVARVGPVYTPPAIRRHGYAGAVTAAASREMLERGCSTCCLFTDLRNPTSNHVYAGIGYQPLMDFGEFWFRP
jgi:predicted GNAT family acetyltransferase